MPNPNSANESVANIAAVEKTLKEMAQRSPDLKKFLEQDAHYKKIKPAYLSALYDYHAIRHPYSDKSFHASLIRQEELNLDESDSYFNKSKCEMLWSKDLKKTTEQAFFSSRERCRVFESHINNRGGPGDQREIADFNQQNIKHGITETDLDLHRALSSTRLQALKMEEKIIGSRADSSDTLRKVNERMTNAIKKLHFTADDSTIPLSGATLKKALADEKKALQHLTDNKDMLAKKFKEASAFLEEEYKQRHKGKENVEKDSKKAMKTELWSYHDEKRRLDKPGTLIDFLDLMDAKMERSKKEKKEKSPMDTALHDASSAADMLSSASLQDMSDAVTPSAPSATKVPYKPRQI